MGLLTLFNVLLVLATYAEAQSTECPWLFYRFSADHTYCKTNNPQCSILSTLVTLNDVSTILKEHNVYRSRIALGKEQQLPPASDMLQMVSTHLKLVTIFWTKKTNFIYIKNGPITISFTFFKNVISQKLPILNYYCL